MALELVYTSAERGLRAGTSGFCTVAMTRGRSSTSCSTTSPSTRVRTARTACACGSSSAGSSPISSADPPAAAPPAPARDDACRWAARRARSASRATASSSIPVRAMRANRLSAAAPSGRVRSTTSPFDWWAASAAGVPARQKRSAHGVPATGCRK
ncbi:MAG: hypothetical protein ACKOTD_07530 [Phycisphaerales bacterium]